MSEFPSIPSFVYPFFHILLLSSPWPPVPYLVFLFSYVHLILSAILFFVLHWDNLLPPFLFVIY